MSGKKSAKKASKKAPEGKSRAERTRAPLPHVIRPEEDAPTLKTPRGTFDLENPVLPAWVAEDALRSGGYPYDKELKGKEYAATLKRLQIELVKLQKHAAEKRLRIVALFEGRDAAGKGGAIRAILENMNPRAARSVALPKPTETERGQWYFQRYVEHLPTAGEIVLFDRSWYNRAGVERVMGFCAETDVKSFLKQTPPFEAQLVEDKIIFFKFWLDIGRAMQLERFFERRHNPLKIWKLSPIDYAALGKWDEYTRARDAMLKATHTREAPWNVVLSNDKRRAHLAIISHMLSGLDYAGKDAEAVGLPDAKIFGSPSILA